MNRNDRATMDHVRQQLEKCYKNILHLYVSSAVQFKMLPNW